KPSVGLHWRCMFLISWGASIEVEAFEGEDVSFRCSHKYASTNHKYLCKDQCADGGDKLVTVQAGGRAASGRITLVDSGDGGFTVTFSHLQLSDMGQYWCAVDLRPDHVTFIHLNVSRGTSMSRQDTGSLSCSSSVPDCDDLLVLPAAAPPPPPPDCCSHFTSKHRESTESLGLGDYVGPKPIDPYQHLDLSELEEHVYHSLNGPLGVNKHINCC
uniref:Immunoglobulin domain-containing protein n=1 Tax=Gasterosteus aculeatus aculeatus TaxID=481459 RepID=A0AAQ4Q0U0_GASAC